MSERWVDPVIEAYKKDVDVTLIDEALKRTYDERLTALERFARMVDAQRAAALGHELEIICDRKV